MSLDWRWGIEHWQCHHQLIFPTFISESHKLPPSSDPITSLHCENHPINRLGYLFSSHLQTLKQWPGHQVTAATGNLSKLTSSLVIKESIVCLLCFMVPYVESKIFSFSLSKHFSFDKLTISFAVTGSFVRSENMFQWNIKTHYTNDLWKLARSRHGGLSKVPHSHQEPGHVIFPTHPVMSPSLRGNTLSENDAVLNGAAF